MAVLLKATTSSLPKAFLLCIGDELVSGQVLNTNAFFLARALAQLGFEVKQQLVLRDEVNTIASEVSRLRRLRENKILFFTGGLGATADDCTLQGIAKAYKVKLLKNEAQLRRLQKAAKHYQSDRLISERFFSQALFPETFQVDKNPWGTAPLVYRLPAAGSPPSEAGIFLLPGVPSECLLLFHKKVVPLLKRRYFTRGTRLRAENKIYSSALRVINVSEVAVQQHFDALTAPDKLRLALLPDNGEVLAYLTAKDPRLTRSYQQKLFKALRHAPSLKGKLIYRSAAPLSQYLHQWFLRLQLKVGFVESLSGGLLSAAFVQYSGASGYLQSATVAYSNASKQRLAGVKLKTLKTQGAVSAQCAMELAEGYAKRHGLSLVLSTTGIAGPTGASERKPVGLVYVGLYAAPSLWHRVGLKAGPRVKELHLKRVKQPLSPRLSAALQERSWIQNRTVKQALIFLAETGLLGEVKNPL